MSNNNNYNTPPRSNIIPQIPTLRRSGINGLTNDEIEEAWGVPSPEPFRRQNAYTGDNDNDNDNDNMQNIEGMTPTSMRSPTNMSPRSTSSVEEEEEDNAMDVTTPEQVNIVTPDEEDDAVGGKKMRKKRKTRRGKKTKKSKKNKKTKRKYKKQRTKK